MTLMAIYRFKYYPDKGWRLTQLDPIKGNIIGYIDNYGEYVKILRAHPELKRHYSSDNVRDKKFLVMALKNLERYKYSIAHRMKEAMKLGVTTEEIDALIRQREKLIEGIEDPLIPIEILLRPPETLPIKKSDYIDNRPEYLSLEERKKRHKKPKTKRKVKRCKCKK